MEWIILNLVLMINVVLPAVQSVAKEMVENPTIDKTQDFKPIIKDLIPAFTNIAAQISTAYGQDLDEFKKVSLQLYERPKKTSNFVKLKDELLSEPLAEKYKISTSDTMNLCQNFNAEAKEEMEIIGENKDLISNPKLLRYLDDLVQGAGKSGEVLIAAVKKADIEFVETELNNDGRNAVQDVADSVQKLKSGVNMGIIGELLSNLGQYSNLNDNATTGGKLNEMFHKADKSAATELLNQFRVQTLKQGQLIDWVIQEADPTHQDTLVLAALNTKAKSQVEAIEQAIKKQATSSEPLQPKDLEQFSETVKSIQSTFVESKTLCHKNVFFNGASK